MKNNLWILPLTYMAYVISFHVGNNQLLLYDKGIRAEHFIHTPLCMIIVLCVWIILEIGFVFLEKLVQEL